MAQTMVVPKDFSRVEHLSTYNDNVYTNGDMLIREKCSYDYIYYYYEVDAEGKNIEFLGAENFSIFDESTTDVVFLDSYFC